MLVRMDKPAPTTGQPPLAAELSKKPLPRAAAAQASTGGRQSGSMAAWLCAAAFTSALLVLGRSAGAADAAVPAPATHAHSVGFISAPDGVPLCVFEAGNPKGRELLLIHGFSQSYAVFKRQYEGALAADHRIVAFDLRGHGCSGKPWTEAAYSDTRIWADDVAAVIKAKQLKNPLVVGWSFGGYVVVNYVQHHGGSGIAGAVLVGSNAGMLPPPTDPKLIAQMDAQRAANANKQPDIEAGIAEGHGFVRIMTAKPAPPDMADIMFATNQMLPAYARRAMSNRSLQADQAVPSMKTPMLLLVGDKDGSQSVEALGGLAKRLPDGRIKVLPSAGHAAFIDSPQEFDDALREFEAYAATRH